MLTARISRKHISFNYELPSVCVVRGKAKKTCADCVVISHTEWWRIPLKASVSVLGGSIAGSAAAENVKSNVTNKISLPMCSEHAEVYKRINRITQIYVGVIVLILIALIPFLGAHGHVQALLIVFGILFTISKRENRIWQ